LSDEFHYVRTAGADGGVDAIEGPAIGLDLESILKDGLPPFNVALEIIAGCCEILDISDEDGEIHGNIEAKYIFIDDTGAISIESFGADRQESRAPEAEIDTLTDLYGLGFLAFSLFSPNPPESLSQDDPDDHDDAVIDAVLTINFEHLAEEMVGDVQWYIAKLLSFEPEDRPTAVDAWRTFIAFADACDGPDVIDWCAAALDGEGERRDSDEAARAMAPPPEGSEAEPESEEEDLGGPVLSAGPLKKGIQLGGGSAPKGQATAFWSKDAMKAALAQEEAEEEVDGTFRPSVGGGAATSFWSKEQMMAMADGNSQAPRPKRGGGESRGGHVRDATSFQPDSSLPGQDQEAEISEDNIPTVVSQPSPIATATPGPLAAGPVAAEAPVASKMPLIVGAVVVLLVLACGAAGIGGGLFYSMSGDDDSSTAAPAPAVAPAPTPKRDTGQEVTTKPKPAPIQAKPKPKTTPKPKPRPRPKPKPAPTGGPAKVAFTAAGRGKLTCSGVKKDFDGSVSLTFQPYELPVSCVINMDGKQGSFLVKGSGSINCNPSGASVVCDKPEVP
jgi:hypothetical protein